MAAVAALERLAREEHAVAHRPGQVRRDAPVAEGIPLDPEASRAGGGRRVADRTALLGLVVEEHLRADFHVSEQFHVLDRVEAPAHRVHVQVRDPRPERQTRVPEAEGVERLVSRPGQVAADRRPGLPRRSLSPEA